MATTTYAIFECAHTEKLFKVYSGRGGSGPYLEQYNGTEYNTLMELPTNNTNDTQRYIIESIRDGMDRAAIHCESSPEEFILRDTDSRYRIHHPYK